MFAFSLFTWLVLNLRCRGTYQLIYAFPLYFSPCSYLHLDADTMGGAHQACLLMMLVRVRGPSRSTGQRWMSFCTCILSIKEIRFCNRQNSKHTVKAHRERYNHRSNSDVSSLVLPAPTYRHIDLSHKHAVQQRQDESASEPCPTSTFTRPFPTRSLQLRNHPNRDHRHKHDRGRRRSWSKVV